MAAKPTADAHARSGGAIPASDARYQLDFENELAGASASAFLEARALGTKVGQAIERAYAVVASGVLRKLERFEDESAARRSRRRAKPPARSSAPAKSSPAAK